MLSEVERAELALLKAQEARARRACPLLYFSTARRPMQRPFFYDNNKVSALLSGNKAGKDYLMVHRLAIAHGRGRIEPLDLPGSFAPFRSMRCMQEGGPIRTRYYVPVMETWRNTVVPLLMKAFPTEWRDGRKSTDGSGFNRGDDTFYLRDGSYVKGLSYEGFQRDEQTAEAAELDFVLLSEVPPYALYKQGYSRTLTTGGKIWIACTRNERTSPYPMAWIRSEIIRAKAGSGIAHYFLSTKENVFALIDELREAGLSDAAEQLEQNWNQTWEQLTEQERAVQLGGEWSGQGGIVFGDFNEQDHLYSVPGMKADYFVAMAAAGKGEIWAGMDHGRTHPTVVAYIYFATSAFEPLQIVEDDLIVIGEYYRANAKIVDHLPALQALHKRFAPQGYFCDPHMWDDDDAISGISPAVLYSTPSTLAKLVRARHKGATVDESIALAPLYKGRNEPGAVDAGVQVLAALLRRRPGGAYEWPRLRLLAEDGVCVAPWIKRGFEEWAANDDSERQLRNEKYSEFMKDPMDATRYVTVARARAWDVPVLGARPPSVFNPTTGMSLEEFCALREGAVA